MNASRSRFLMSRLCLIAVLGWMVGNVPSARAQVTTAVPFLLIEPDSRAAAMGNTGVAIATDANAVFWNPAGLAFQEYAAGSFTHSNWLPEFGADLSLEYLMGAYPVPGIGTFGAHVTYFNLGQYEVRNAQNEKLDVFKAYELAIGVSFGRKVTEHFALGAGLRGIYSKLADQTGTGIDVSPATTFAFDLAGLYRMDPFQLGSVPTVFSAGFNLANMGPGVSYVDDKYNTSDPIPTTLRFGYAFTFHFDEYNRLTFANDFSKLLVHKSAEQVNDSTTIYRADPFYQALFTSWQSLDTNPNEPGTELGLLEQFMVGLGMEYWYNDLFALRAGYYYEAPDNGDRQFLSFGAGLRYNIFGVDLSYLYALEEDSPLSNTLRVSVLLDLKR